MQSCWEILGIEKTKDKLAIKRAYTNLAHSISPEDDPEGFKRIHSAYKQAMMYASDKENKSFAPPVENKNFQNTESVHRNTKPHQDSGTEEEFDFSNIIVEDDEFSQEVERILDSIDELKASHALDSADYIERWNSSTLDAVSISMFNLYSALYKETEDGSIWDSFFDEPLIKHMIHERKFREQLRSRYPEETEAGSIIAKHCDKQDEVVAAEEEAEHEKLVEENMKTKLKLFWLWMSLGTFTTLLFAGLVAFAFTNDVVVVFGILFLILEFLIFSMCNYYRASNWGKRITPGSLASLYTRNIIVIFSNILYLFIVILSMVESDWATRCIHSAFTLAGIAGAVAMCIQHKILSK